MFRFEVNGLVYGSSAPVSFALRSGECIGVTGPSGCGKTRLLRALADLDAWDGEILLNRQLPSAMPACQWRLQVAYLPAESQWWFDTVGAHFKTVPPAEDRTALGLDPEVMTWPVARLSSGEKQRLGILRTLVNQPAVLLLDEPTAHLDPEHACAVEALISRRCRGGMMAVWVAHDLDQLKRMAPRGYRITAQGEWKEVASWA